MALWRCLFPINATGAVDAATGTANWPQIAPGTYFADGPGLEYAWMVPGGYVAGAAAEPIDEAAIALFWAAGPCQLPGPLPVSRPAIAWMPYPAGGGTRPMILTGAGASLGFRNWTDTRGAAP
jgi:hypothetical protein